MEVKIKQGEEMIDATIEMVDGVMVVSPKEVKWEPSYIGKHYFKPRLEMGQFISDETRWINDVSDKAYYEKGWCFETGQECQEFCDRLNEAINSVKP